MNKTKKRAHKRAALKSGSFKWPYPLTSNYKVQNIRAHKQRFGTGLLVSKRIVEAMMIATLGSDVPF